MPFSFFQMPVYDVNQIINKKSVWVSIFNLKILVYIHNSFKSVTMMYHSILQLYSKPNKTHTAPIMWLVCMVFIRDVRSVKYGHMIILIIHLFNLQINNEVIFQFVFSCLGRMQSFFSQLLHVIMDSSEQPLSSLSTRVGCTENWKMNTG